MNRKFCLHLAITLFAVFGLAAPVQAELVTNGSFELPGLQSDTSSVVAPEFWTVEGLPPSLHNGKPTAEFPGAQEGSQYVGLGIESNDVPNAISQVVQISSPDAYVVKWFDTTLIAPPTVPQTSLYVVSVWDTSDQLIGSDSFEAYAGVTSWTEKSLTVNIPTAGQYRLLFNPSAPTGRPATLLDNVSMSLVAVPEPSTLGLCAGIAAIFATRRRRRVTMTCTEAAESWFLKWSIVRRRSVMSVVRQLSISRQ